MMVRVIEAGLKRVVDRAVERDLLPEYVVMYRALRGSPVEEELKRYFGGLRKGTTESRGDLADFEKLMKPDLTGLSPGIWILPQEEWRRTFKGVLKVEPFYEKEKEGLFVLRMTLGSGVIVACIAGQEKRGELFGELKLMVGVRE